MEQLNAFLAHNNLSLNDQQKQAILRTDGATLLLAVPGSGKTTVVICRIAYMIKECGISPDTILTLTFSRAGARDLNRRYRTLFGSKDAENLRFSTIHSFSLSVIRNYERLYHRKAFNILENSGPVLRELYLKLFKSWPSDSDLSDISSAITYAKNMMLGADAIGDMKVGDLDFPKIFYAYEAYKTQGHLMDFDDMLKYAFLLLKKNPELLRIFTRQYRYIHIDEAQDTSKIQYEIIYLLTRENPNIFIVGDEDQSIYGFRGAWPEGLMGFKKQYPEGEILLMETNHRTTAKLVAAANQFIKLNTERYLKNMHTHNPAGVSAVHEYVPTVEAQYHFILNSVRHEAKETAVLYRNNESVIPLVDLFEREGIAYQVKEHSPLFFTHFVVQDIKNFVALANDPTDMALFEKLYYKINCNLSRRNIDAARAAHKPGKNVFHTLLSLEDLPDWLMDRVSDAEQRFKRLKKMSASEGIGYIYSQMGYREHLDYRIESGCRAEVIDQKMNILETLAARETTMALFWERLDTLQSVLQENRHPRQGVTFSTIHSSKGLEFEKVFIIDAIEGEFPSLQAIGDDPESRRLFCEEVRLFYVGVTRAKKELEFISVGKKNQRHNKRPVSQFVTLFMNEKPPKQKAKEKVKQILGRTSKPAPSRKSGGFDIALFRSPHPSAENLDLSGYVPGSTLFHKSFGQGVIKSRQDDRVQVTFEGCGTKTLNLEICILNGIISGTKP